jgi:hypothetical protein
MDPVRAPYTQGAGAHILWCAVGKAGPTGRRGPVGKLSILAEIWVFLRVRKKWWLVPIFGMLLLMAGVLLLTEGSAIAPFIYALF